MLNLDNADRKYIMFVATGRMFVEGPKGVNGSWGLLILG